MNGKKFNSDRAPLAVGLYPHARRVGNLLYLSGVGPRKVDQKDIPGVILQENGMMILTCKLYFQELFVLKKENLVK